MLKTLAFSQVSHKLSAPSITGGLPQGLVIQLWIRRTTGGDGGSRQPIVALTGSDTKVVLGSGERPDALLLTVTTPEFTYELAAPGAMPADRWAQVRAVLRPNGTATLSVLGMTVASNFVGIVGTSPLTPTIGGGSFTGDLSQLQIWTHAAPAKLSYEPPPLDAAELWAYYPLEALKQGANAQQFVTPDAGPNKRDAVGAVEQTVRWHDEAQADGGGSFLRFAGDAAEARLSPISCLSGQLAMEAWVRGEADDAKPSAVIQLLGAHGQAALIAGGKDGQVALVVIPDGVTIEVCSAKGLIKKNEWSHVAATVGFDAAKQTIVARVFHQGAQVAAAELSALTDQQGPPKFAPLHALLHEALVTRCVLGGAVPGGARFRGGMAEARIWQKSAPERVGAMWLARAHGGEPALLAAYRMASMTAGVFDDIGPRRARGTATGQVTVVTSGGPPIASLRAARAFRVGGRAKLVREWLPAALAGSPATGKAGAHRSVFDATLEVTARDGGVPTDRKLEVRVDRAMTALVETDGVVKKTAWSAATSYLLTIPHSGRLRVRMLADSVSCPTLRARVAGAPGGLWTILRPDQTAQSRLRAVTGTSLLSPGAGRTSPMPAGSTPADADALAVALRQLATQCPPRPQSVTPAVFKQKKWVIQTFGLGDIGGVFDDVGDAAEELGEVIVDTAEDAGEVIVDTAEDAGEAVVDTAEDTGEAIAGAAVDVSNAVVGAAETVVTGAKRTAKSAAGLLKQGAAQVAALRVKANKTAARVGQEAISTLIDSADSLAIFVDETVEAAGGWVEVIGTSIVNGAEVAWRTVVSGVEDALTAVTALLKRIGAEIQQFIDYLAYLFAWGDFLAESDKLYGTLEQSIQGLGGMLQQAGSYKDELGKTLRSTVKKAVGNRTVGDLFGLRIDRSNPAIEHLEYFLEQVQRAIESAEAVFEGVADVATGEASPSPALLGSAEASAARLPMSSLANPLTLLTTPVKDLLAGNGALADGSSSLLDAAFSEIASSGAQAITTAVDQVRARIKVPWLTDMIETVILGGRSFTLLRAAALAGAIPSVLTSKLSDGQKKEESGSITGIVGPSSQPKSTKTPQQKAEAERSRRALWASTGLGLINSAVVVGKTVLEMRKVKKGIGILTVSSGICICMRGYCTSLLLSRYSQEARPFAKTNVWFDVIEGVYTVLRGLRKAESDAKWAKFDMAFHGILGLAITTSSAIALGSGKLGDTQARTGFAFRCTSWVGNSMVRLAEKSDDVMTSPTAKKCTLGLAAIVAVVEIAEAVNGNVDDVLSTE